MNEIETILLKKAIKGDVDAFEKLISFYEKLIYNIAYRKLMNREDAQDAAQETIVKIYKNINKCNSTISFKSWICAITVNTCIDELRKRKNNMEYLDEKVSAEDSEMVKQVKSDEVTPEEAMIKKELGAALSAAICELPEDHKNLIVLRDIQGLSYQELADACGISLGTVKSRLSRARENLKKILISDREHIYT